MTILEKLAKFNTSELSDAMDSLGIETVLLGIKPLSTGMKMIGPAYTVKYLPYDTMPETFKGAGNYIDEVPSGAVIVIDNEGREDCTTWGDILTHVAIKKGIYGTVIHGASRDVETIIGVHYPVFSKAVTMRSGKNRVYKACEQVELTIGQVTVSPGDIIIGDDCGVLSIPPRYVEAIIERASNIQMTEQRIISAIDEGMSLESAREMHRYDMPWLNQQEKHKC